MSTTISPPDISHRPHNFTIERVVALPTDKVFKAWTSEFDKWFAAEGTLLGKVEVNAPFFFEVHHHGERYPHYGRFLKLETDKLVEVTWLTGPKGTHGVETVLTIELTPDAKGTHLKLTHAGFQDDESKKQHKVSWPFVLDQLEAKLSE